MTRSCLFCVSVLLASAGIAHAGDATQLVCSGVAKADDGSRAAVSIQYRDERHPDGKSRNVTLYAVAADRLFKAQWHKTGDTEQGVPIVLKAGTLVVFRGTYSLAGDKGMQLTGKWSRDGKEKPHAIDVTLPCVDVSP